MTPKPDRSQGWAQFNEGVQTTSYFLLQAEGAAQELNRLMEEDVCPTDELVSHAKRAAVYDFAVGRAATGALNGAQVLHQTRPGFGKHPDLDEAIGRGFFHYEHLSTLFHPIGLHFQALTTFLAGRDMRSEVQSELGEVLKRKR